MHSLFGDLTPNYRQSTMEESIRGSGPEMPPGWMELIDAASNRPFYVHQATGRTVFHYEEIWKTPPQVMKRRARSSPSPHRVPVTRTPEVPEVSFASTPATQQTAASTVDLSESQETSGRFETQPPARFQALGVPLRINVEHEQPAMSQLMTPYGLGTMDDEGHVMPPLMIARKKLKYAYESDEEEDSETEVQD
jgi:hypothetical protein